MAPFFEVVCSTCFEQREEVLRSLISRRKHNKWAESLAVLRNLKQLENTNTAVNHLSLDASLDATKSIFPKQRGPSHTAKRAWPSDGPNTACITVRGWSRNCRQNTTAPWRNDISANCVTVAGLILAQNPELTHSQRRSEHVTLLVAAVESLNNLRILMFSLYILVCVILKSPDSLRWRYFDSLSRARTRMKDQSLLPELD